MNFLFYLTIAAFAGLVTGAFSNDDQLEYSDNDNYDDYDDEENDNQMMLEEVEMEPNEVEDSKKNAEEKPKKVAGAAKPFLNDGLPREVNWVEKGAVSGVKNQFSCNAGYAFAALAALEGRYYLKRRFMVDLSVQSVLDCSLMFGNKGCRVGFIASTYNFIVHNNGTNREVDYPYTVLPNECRLHPRKLVANIKKYVEIVGEEKLKKAVAEGPVAVVIDARPRSFKNYTSGIYDDPNCGNVGSNHAVAVVGYGTDPTENKDYWLIKNSWGTNWGLKGYMKLVRGKRMCAIGSSAIFPVL